MARGWESKSVEQQQADALGDRDSGRPRLSEAEQRRNRQRESLVLARKRLADELQSATRPERLRMLHESLAEVDKQLSSFDSVTDPPAPK